MQTEEAEPVQVVAPEPVFALNSAGVVQNDYARCVEFFEYRHQHIEKCFLFQSDWGDEESCYDGLISHPQAAVQIVLARWNTNVVVQGHSLRLGELARAFDPLGNRLIIIGTRLGPAVVYERTNDPGTYVCHMTSELASLGLAAEGQRLSYAQLRDVLGGTDEADPLPAAWNLGQRVEMNYGSTVESLRQRRQTLTLHG